MEDLREDCRVGCFPFLYSNRTILHCWTYEYGTNIFILIDTIKRTKYIKNNVYLYNIEYAKVQC